MAFASNGTKHPDGIVIINASEAEQVCVLKTDSTKANSWKAHRTTEAGEKFQALPDLSGQPHINLPPHSLVTLSGL